MNKTAFPLAIVSLLLVMEYYVFGLSAVLLVTAIPGIVSAVMEQSPSRKAKTWARGLFYIALLPGIYLLMVGLGFLYGQVLR